MKHALYRVLCLLFAVAAVALFTCVLTGCSIDPATGKSVFDPGKAQAIVNSPETQAAAGVAPYGLGALATASLSMLFGYMAKKSTEKHAAITGALTHAVTAAAGAIQADSGVTLTTALAAPSAVTS